MVARGGRRLFNLGAFYRSLLRAYGPQGWWPARTRFEVVVGAILTQNISWVRVEQALRNLRRGGFLSYKTMSRASHARLTRMLRPAGYYNQKAHRILGFLRVIRAEYDGRLENLLRQPAGRLRRRLLAITGVGPETADAIVLYAAGHPVFVIDAYTRRVLARHGVIRGDEPYEQVQRLMEDGCAGEEPDPAGRARMFNEYHALLVRVAKERCLKRVAHCDGCPLEEFLPHRAVLLPPPPCTVRRTTSRSGRRPSGIMEI